MDDISVTKLCEAIDEWIIGRNAKRDREIMKARYVEGLCYEPLAERFGMSARQIRRIVYKCELQVFRHL